MKKKITILIIGLIILGLSLFIVINYIFNNEKENTSKNIMYIKTNALIKITFEDNCSKDKCDLSSFNILDFETIFDDDKLYQDKKIDNITLDKLINEIIELEEINEIDITTNKEIANNLFNDKYKDMDFSINYEDELDENKIIEDYENDVKYYTINFDTDGGSTIDSVVIKSGKVLTKPEEPKRDGYIFIEWQLDNKTYDFSSAVTDDISLKAVWKKVEVTTTKSNSSSGNTTKKVNSSSTPKELNLNENIKVKIGTKTVLCGFAMFISNFDTVFPELANRGKSIPYFPVDGAAGEITEEDFTANADRITYNTQKENNALNLLKSYQNSKTEGIAHVEYGIENHRITYSYNYLTFTNISYKPESINVNKKIDDVFSSAYKFYGPCGGGFDTAVDLTEELCAEYNLKCIRY